MSPGDRIAGDIAGSYSGGSLSIEGIIFTYNV